MAVGSCVRYGDPNVKWAVVTYLCLPYGQSGAGDGGKQLTVTGDAQGDYLAVNIGLRVSPLQAAVGCVRRLRRRAVRPLRHRGIVLSIVISGLGLCGMGVGVGVGVRVSVLVVPPVDCGGGCLAVDTVVGGDVTLSRQLALAGGVDSGAPNGPEHGFLGRAMPAFGKLHFSWGFEELDGRRGASSGTCDAAV